jgi:hypothetical protein
MAGRRQRLSRVQAISKMLGWWDTHSENCKRVVPFWRREAGKGHGGDTRRSRDGEYSNPAPSTGENLTRSIRAPKILPSRLRVAPVADEMLRKMAHRRQTKAGRALTPKSPGFESAAGTGARTDGGLIFHLVQFAPERRTIAQPSSAP